MFSLILQSFCGFGAFQNDEFYWMSYLGIWFKMASVLESRTTGCPAKKYIQLKMFIFEEVWNKSKQNFHGYKNISLPSVGSIYWVNVLRNHLIII